MFYILYIFISQFSLMKERLVIFTVLMAVVFVGISSMTTTFGNLFHNTPANTPDVSNSNGDLFYNTPANTPDASNSKVEINSNQNNFQVGEINTGAQNCAENNVNSQNTAGDEGLDCHDIQDEATENHSDADQN